MDMGSSPNTAARSSMDPRDGGAPIVERRRLEAVPASEELVQDLLVEVFGRFDMPLKPKNDVRIAVEELLVNVVSYAYPSGTGDFEVAIEADPEARSVTVVLTDWGVPFDPFSYEAAKPLRVDNIADAPIGGLGIVMVKGLMDEYGYRRVGDANEVRIVKRWPAPEPEGAAVLPPDMGIDAMGKLQEELDDDDLAAIAGGLTMPLNAPWPF